MAIRIKSSVRLRGLSPEGLYIALAAVDVGIEQGITVWITSATDGDHMPGSYHHTGDALDLDTQDIPLARLALHLRCRLGSGYQVIEERTHVHVERDRP